ncbi:hypothetical protein FD755_012634 [Muntiacus reevesi]|uniref:PID domain-containing protein n=1 Tax=Muntiacus reevesi TaxID=9886 RepID=A0A5N3XTZ0_MUNRE|nr:hypothetical protein FD755_012634 [Muntiacus reevesi]
MPVWSTDPQILLVSVPVTRASIQTQMGNIGNHPAFNNQNSLSGSPIPWWREYSGPLAKDVRSLIPRKLSLANCCLETFPLPFKTRMRKSTEHMKKIPTVILSITYKGVKFIDASNKNTIAEHEVRNIFRAAQDPEDLCTFACITKDLQTSHHYCHVFSTVDVNLTYEIILTLGQAFKLAYQLALQAQKARPMGASATEVMETRSSKPVPKPWVGVRQSSAENMMTCLLHPFTFSPETEAKSGVSKANC